MIRCLLHLTLRKNMMMLLYFHKFSVILSRDFFLFSSDSNFTILNATVESVLWRRRYFHLI